MGLWAYLRQAFDSLAADARVACQVIADAWREFLRQHRLARERKVKKIRYYEIVEPDAAPEAIEEGTMKLRMRYPCDPGIRISSGFGMRFHPITGTEMFHKGVDFATPEGTPVLAMSSGRVFRVGYENSLNFGGGLGLRIWVESMVGAIPIFWWVGHLSKTHVVEGQEITVGEEIALSGNTGASTAPHLHVQAREKDTMTWYDFDFYV